MLLRDKRAVCWEDTDLGRSWIIGELSEMNKIWGWYVLGGSRKASYDCKGARGTEYLSTFSTTGYKRNTKVWLLGPNHYKFRAWGEGRKGGIAEQGGITSPHIRVGPKKSSRGGRGRTSPNWIEWVGTVITTEKRKKGLLTRY